MFFLRLTAFFSFAFAALAAEVETKEITVSSKIGKLILRPVFEGPTEDRHMQSVEVRDAKGKLVQTIDHEITADFKYTPWEFDEVVKFVDANRDGFPDLALDNGGYSNFGNHSYDFFCWEPSLSRFVRDKELCDADISDFEGSYLVSNSCGRGWSAQSTYQWHAGHLRIIESSSGGNNGRGGDYQYFVRHVYKDDHSSTSYEIREDDSGDLERMIKDDFSEEGWKNGIWFKVQTYKDGKLVKESRELFHEEPWKRAKKAKKKD